MSFFDDDEDDFRPPIIDLEALQEEMTQELIGLKKRELTDMVMRQDSLRFPMKTEEEDLNDSFSAYDVEMEHCLSTSEEEADEIRSEIEHLNRRHLLCLIDRQDSLRWENHKQRPSVESPSAFRPTTPNYKAWDDEWEAELNSELAVQKEMKRRFSGFGSEANQTERESILQEENLRLISELAHQRMISSKLQSKVEQTKADSASLRKQLSEMEKLLEENQDLVEASQSQIEDLTYELELVREEANAIRVDADKERIQFANERIELMQECKLQKAELDFAFEQLRDDVKACTSEEILTRQLGHISEYEKVATHIRARLAMIHLARQDQPCVICLDRARTHAPVPCGHRSVCEKCSESLEQCPLCRADAVNFLKIYV